MSSTPSSQGMASPPNTAKPKTPPRSTTTRGRIDSILADARTRKAEMGKSDTSESPSASPRAGLLVESSADEETSFVRRESGGTTVDYQSTKVGSQQGVKRSKNDERNRQRDDGETRRESTGDDQESWWARIIADYGSIELENKGSVARDHLALERTCLAWLRTSLAFASIGIAVTQLFRLNTTTAANGSDPYRHLRQMGKPLGATFLGISILMLGVGFHRYFEAQHWIIRGKFPASRGSVALVTAITFALVVASLIIVIVVQPGQFEKR